MRVRQRCQLRADLGRNKNRSRLRLSCIAGESPPGATRPGCAVPIGARIAVDLRPPLSETGDDSPEAPILTASTSGRLGRSIPIDPRDDSLALRTPGGLRTGAEGTAIAMANVL